VFGNFFKKDTIPNVAGMASAAAHSLVSANSEGLTFAAPGGSVSDWLAMPFAFGADADLGARLAQIYTEGLGERRETEFVIPWDQLYEVLSSPEFGDQREALRIPPDSPLRPQVMTRNAVSDPNFAFQLDGWIDKQGKAAQPQPKVSGAVLETPDGPQLLPRAVWQLLQAVREFHAMPADQRSRSFNEQLLGRVRTLAQQSGCPTSDYVTRTIVLTPERLQLGMRQAVLADDMRTVEVIPSFDDAPQRWLERFDALPLQDSYDVPDGASLVRVVLSPEVRQVLGEIKAMPGRRASGARAEAFVRNPMAVLVH